MPCIGPFIERALEQLLAAEVQKVLLLSANHRADPNFLELARRLNRLRGLLGRCTPREG